MKREFDFLENDIIYEDMENIAREMKATEWLFQSSVLITGAYGMLASYFVYYLIYLNECKNAGITIYAQGRNNEKMYERYGRYIDKEYFHIIKQDICQQVELDIEVNYIIHAASLASPEKYTVNPIDTALPNTLGTYYLLDYARKQVKFKHFLYFSSGDVYGELPARNDMYCESDYGFIDCLNLRNSYGESKRMGENFCVGFVSQYKVPASIVRIAHTYGPTLDLLSDKRMFAEFVRNLVDEEDIVMKSDGSAERMFCYVSDAIKAFLLILKDGKSGEAYNMYNNTQIYSIREVAETLVNLFPEKRLKVIQVSRSSDSTYTESLIHKSPIMSTEKLEKLGWRPRINLETGFKRTVISFSERVLQ